MKLVFRFHCLAVINYLVRNKFNNMAFKEGTDLVSYSSLFLRFFASPDQSYLQMEREIYELKRQRDLVQSQLELERSSHKEQKVC